MNAQALIDTRFLQHNHHLDSPQQFAALDPNLRRLKQQQYIYHSPILQQLPVDIPGIYTLGGGRQIGKTTLLKQWMQLLLEKHNITPSAIAFFSGELIDDHHALLNLLQNYLTASTNNTANNNGHTPNLRYLIIDEITYIRDWDKAVKYTADAGMLDEVELILTGSDLVMIQEARMRFPGRRGRANEVDFHFYPLTFAETVALKGFATKTIDIDELYQLFYAYLKHGGYLTAINDMARSNTILPATLRTYSDWIRGDILRRGKQENYLQELLGAIIKHYGSQISWHTLARDLSIEHHKTVADYIQLLSSMDVVFIQSALREDKLTAAPKKAKKLAFTDPFIFHAIRAWLSPTENPYQTQIEPAINDAELVSKLVEACVTTHYQRLYPTYYIKAEGEVDIAYVEKNRFFPIEIKWSNQIRPNEIKQIKKYPQGRILAKTRVAGNIGAIPVEPLPLALLAISPPLQQ